MALPQSPSGADLAVNINEDGPMKPVQNQKPAKFFDKPRNRWLTAAGLLTLVAIPCIVAPVVVTQQNKDEAASSSALDSNGQPLSLTNSDGILVANSGYTTAAGEGSEGTGPRLGSPAHSHLRLQH